MNYIPKRDRAVQSVSVFAKAEAQAFVVRFTAGDIIKQLGPFSHAEAVDKRDTLATAGVTLDHQPDRGIIRGIGADYGYGIDSVHTSNRDQFGFSDPDWYLRDKIIRAATAIANARRDGLDPDIRDHVAAAEAIGAVPPGPRRKRLQEVYVSLTEGAGGSAGAGKSESQEVAA